jgi:hypothetical protein
MTLKSNGHLVFGLKRKKALELIREPFKAGAGTTGIEPAIFGLTGRRVNHYTTSPAESGYYQIHWSVSTNERPHSGIFTNSDF